MELQQLAKMAADAINQTKLPGLEKSRPHVALRMPVTKHEVKRRWLVPQARSPIGDVVARCEAYDVVMFDAVELLAWLMAVGAVQTILPKEQESADEPCI